MKRRIIIGIVALFAGAFIMQSCTTHKDLYQRITYQLDNKDGQGKVNQENFIVKYDGFEIAYNTDGGCSLMNNSDSIIYIDMAESFFISNRIESTSLYNSNIYVEGGSIDHGFTQTKGEVHRQAERMIIIPPHAFTNLPFRPLQEIAETRENDGKKAGNTYTYDNKYTDLNAHRMTYSYSRDGKKSMINNTFSPITEEIFAERPNNSPSSRVYTFEDNEKIYSKGKTIALVSALGGGLLFISAIVIGSILLNR